MTAASPFIRGRGSIVGSPTVGSEYDAGDRDENHRCPSPPAPPRQRTRRSPRRPRPPGPLLLPVPPARNRPRTCRGRCATCASPGRPSGSRSARPTSTSRTRSAKACASSGCPTRSCSSSSAGPATWPTARSSRLCTSSGGRTCCPTSSCSSRSAGGRTTTPRSGPRSRPRSTSTAASCRSTRRSGTRSRERIAYLQADFNDPAAYAT